MNPATILLLCCVQQEPSSTMYLNSTLTMYCGGLPCPQPAPGPTCEVQRDLVSAAIEMRNRKGTTLYEITPTKNSPTVKALRQPTLRAD